MANIYCGSTKYSAVLAWAALTAYSVGDLRRQSATPTVGNERVFRCTTAGTSGATEPSWGVAQGATTNDGTAVWTEVTGQAVYNGDGGGSAWAAPHARLSNAFAWASAGDTIFVSNNHSATQSSALTITTKGTASSPCRVLCVDDATVPPTTLATTATESTTGASAIALTNGFYYMYGVTLNAGSSTSLASITLQSNFSSAGYAIFDNCSFILNNSSVSSKVNLNTTTASTNIVAGVAKNCSFKFGSTSQSIVQGNAPFQLQNISIDATGSTPSTLFASGFQSGSTRLFISDSDFSLITGTLFHDGGSASSLVQCSNCKLGSGVTLVGGTNAGYGAVRTEIYNCDSGATNYRTYIKDYAGTIQQETTTVHTGGASDGTTPFSLRLDSTANAKVLQPLVSQPFSVFVDTTGSAKTARVEIAGGASLNENDIWLELEYMGSSSSPIASRVISNTVSLLGTPSALPSSSESWGGSPASKQYLSVSFTPQMKGYVTARVYLAKASTTVYVDPKITVS